MILARPLAGVAALVTFAALVACPPKTPTVLPPTPSASTNVGSPLGGALFLQGFDVQWTFRPHRMKRLAIGAEGELGARGLTGDLVASVVGGSFANGAVMSDTPEVTLYYGGLVSPEVTFVHGETQLTLSGALGTRKYPEVVAEATVPVSVALPADMATGGVAVWLTGFDFLAGADHPNGYTPHAVAVDLSEPTFRDGHVDFDVHAMFQAAPVLDRVEKLAEYGSTVAVHYTVVLARHGHAQRFGVHAAVEHGVDVDPDEKISKKNDPARIPVTVDVARNLAAAVAGISGFKFELQETGPVDGRYMRAITVGLEDGRYDGARGTYDGLVDLRFANAGKLPRPVRVDASAWFTLLQLPDAAEVRQGRWTPPVDGKGHHVVYPDMQEQPTP